MQSLIGHGEAFRFYSRDSGTMGSHQRVSAERQYNLIYSLNKTVNINLLWKAIC